MAAQRKFSLRAKIAALTEALEQVQDRADKLREENATLREALFREYRELLKILLSNDRERVATFLAARLAKAARQP